MAKVTREQVAVQIFAQENDIAMWPGLTPAWQNHYMAKADEVLPLVNFFADEAWKKGFEDGVDSAQAMTGFTDETAESIFQKEGLER